MELQRVNGLYIKYKNAIAKYKKRIQDLESTNNVSVVCLQYI